MDSLSIELTSLQRFSKTNLSAVKGFNNKNFVKTTNLADFLESLDIWTALNDISSTDIVPFFNNGHRLKSNLDFLGFLKSTQNERLIRDFVGIGRKTKNVIVFSTLVDQTPKPYFLMYLLFAKKVKEVYPSFKFIIYLEDWFPLHFMSKKANEVRVKNYKRLINKFNVDDKTIIASSFFSKKVIPYAFVRETLSNISLGEFISVLPFNKRHPKFILVRDLLNFIWNIFTIYSIQGIYMTNIDSKREFLVYRKALEKNPAVIFFPSAPEKMSSRSTLQFYSRYLSFAGDKTKLIELDKLFLQK